LKHIANLIDLNRVKESKEDERVEIISDETAHVVNLLFRELKAIFPAFRQAWPTDEDFSRAKLNWVKAFQTVRLCRIEQLKHGVEKCRLSGRPFAPSVGEFIEWCKRSPEDCGLPYVNDAFVIAGRINVLYSDYIHPHVPTQTVIKHVLLQIGAKKFRGMAEKEAVKLFGHYYTVACRQYADGDIKDIVQAIAEKPEPHPSDKIRNDEARKRAMDAIRGMGLNVKRTDDK
jgi:hypothetical protein